MNQNCWAKKVELVCVACKAHQDYSIQGRCSSCAGLMDPVYDDAAQVRSDQVDPVSRFFDLLPIQAVNRDAIDVVGNTPCYHATEIGRLFGLPNLFLKDESKNPTGTTKDRMAQLVVAQMQELGIKEFVVSSTGNSSTALAYAVQGVRGLKMHSFAGVDFVDRHEHHDHERIELHVVHDTYVAASNAAKAFAAERGLVFEGGFFNYARREALKLAYLEAFDQMADEPDVVIQAVSSGMGLYGGYRGMREYQRLGRLAGTPRFVCVQQDTCAPMVKAYQDNSPRIEAKHVVENPEGLAHAILRGDPSATYPYMLSIVRETNGCFVDVCRHRILAAWALLYLHHGIQADYAAAAALAAALKLKEKGWLHGHENVLVNLTGGMRRPAVAHRLGQREEAGLLS